MSIPALFPLGNIGASWQIASVGEFGCYVHKGLAYFTGSIAATPGAPSSLLLTLPPELCPPAPVAMTFPLFWRFGFGPRWVIVDPGLVLADEWTAVLNTDGTLVLDAVPPAQVWARPDITVYWRGGFFRDGGLGPSDHHARYPQPFPFTLALGNSSWPLPAPAVDAYTLDPATLAPDFASSVVGWVAHVERNHLGGNAEATVDKPTTLTTALPLDIQVGGTGGEAVSTFEASRKWPIVVTGATVEVDEPPTQITPPGRSPYLAARCPEYLNSAQDPFDFGYIGGPNAIDGADVAPGDFSVGGWAPATQIGYPAGVVATGGTSLCGFGFFGPIECHDGVISLPPVVYDIPALLAMLQPAPDWYQILWIYDVPFPTFFGSWSGFYTSCVPPGSGNCVPQMFDNSWTVTTTGDGLQAVDFGGNPWTSTTGDSSEYVGFVKPGGLGFFIPDTPLYDDGGSGACLAPFVKSGGAYVGQDMAKFFWHKTQNPGVITAALNGQLWQYATGPIWCQVIPFYEFPRNYLKTGDIVDLTNTGWEGVRVGSVAAGVPVPGVRRKT